MLSKSVYLVAQSIARFCVISHKLKFTLMKKSLILVCAVAMFSACGSHKKGAEPQPGTKSLVLYYSQTGTTKKVAELISQKTGADIEAIDAVNPYDGDYDQTIARGKQEIENNILPDINPLQSRIEDYDTVYLGFPVWFGTYAPPMGRLVKDTDFAGKVLIPFCTFGSGGLESSVANLKAAQPNSTILEGFGIRAARLDAASAELDQFLIRLGILSGTAAPLPQYGTPAPVTAEEKALFDEACGDYPMPLGTPVSVAKAAGQECMYYCFTTDSKRPDGESMSFKIYVVKPAADGSKAEFTKVVR